MRQSKKILIATGIYPPSIGGPATYSKMLFEELPKHGIETKVVSFDEVRRWPNGLRHIIYFFTLYNQVNKHDVIYALDPVSVGYPAMLVAKFTRKRFILRVAGDYAWEQASQRWGVTDLLDVFLTNKYSAPVERLRKIQKKVATYAKLIIVPSEYLKNVVMRWGIDQAKIRVIPNAIEGELPTESKSVLRGQLNIDEPTIMSAGRLVPWKGFETLIKRLGPYLKERGVKLLIAGSGPEEDHLKLLVNDMKLEEQVVFMGSLNRIDLLRYIKASDVFVLNTAYEGFSHQILEAMALGTPVISTNISGNSELIEDGIHGFLVSLNAIDDFRDKIELLLNDENKYREISSHAQGRASIFTKENAVRGLISLI